MRTILLTAALLAFGASATAQGIKTPIGTWWDHQIGGLEHYYNSADVCGFPLTERDREVIVKA
jgi:hypothetical protein